MSRDGLTASCSSVPLLRARLGLFVVAANQDHLANCGHWPRATLHNFTQSGCQAINFAFDFAFAEQCVIHFTICHLTNALRSGPFGTALWAQIASM